MSEPCGDWYCRNCGYLSGTRVTNEETCDTCHLPVQWHDLDTITEVERLTTKLSTCQRIVDEQAEDEGLWFVPETAPEAYLQAALRRLHEAVEGKSSEECAMEVLSDG